MFSSPNMSTMSATTSSSAATSPPAGTGAPIRVCLRCSILKRRCNKSLPSCDTCIKRGEPCLYIDLSRFGRGSVFTAIESAKDIHGLAFRTVVEVCGCKQELIEQSISSYFKGVNTWFTVIEQTSFERQARDILDNPTAETCLLVVCMSLINNLPSVTSKTTRKNHGIGDNVYHCAKAILSLVQSKLPMSIPLLQAELLVTMYELSQSMPQQAYMSLGHCLQITKLLGWHSTLFWSADRQVAAPRELKLCSILWWAIVYLDGLLNVGYPDQAYPMLTAGLGLDAVIPLPEAFDQYLAGGFMPQFGGQGRGFRNASVDPIDAMALPEANAACSLSSVLQQLSNPALSSTVFRNALSDSIVNHTTKIMSTKRRPGDFNAAMGTNFIAIMKLNQLGLLGGTSPLMTIDPNHIRAAQAIRTIVGFVCDETRYLAQSADRLDAGGLSPCWALAIYHASLLLVSHGGGALQDPNWLQTVEHLMGSLDIISKRWKIAEGYTQSLSVALNNRLTGYSGGLGR